MGNLHAFTAERKLEWQPQIPQTEQFTPPAPRDDKSEAGSTTKPAQSTEDRSSGDSRWQISLHPDRVDLPAFDRARRLPKTAGTERASLSGSQVRLLCPQPSTVSPDPQRRFPVSERRSLSIMPEKNRAGAATIVHQRCDNYAADDSTQIQPVRNFLRVFFDDHRQAD